MSEILNYFDKHWIQAFMVIFSAFGIARKVFVWLPWRFMRMINIWKSGYPPEHCDADGDLKKKETETQQKEKLG